jgi:predicted nucleic acid-binding protein
VSTLLLDASAILAAFDSDDDLHEAAKTILADPNVTLATLDLARYEVANVALHAWRDPAKVSPLLAAIDRISDDGGVTLATTTLLARAAEIAEQHTLSVYDAAYVAAASQAGATLVSCDTRDLIDKGLASHPADVSGAGSSSSSHSDDGEPPAP